MSYIWINPVVASMFDTYVLDEFLCRHGYTRIEVTKDWGKTVKEKYLEEVTHSTNVIVDVRCPEVGKMLEKVKPMKPVTVPQIPPILIHCGQEIGEMRELCGEEKLIITPCQALADMGNALGLADTTFRTWNQFVEMIGESPERIPLEKSPIPPGFFNELPIKTISVTGEAEIRDYLVSGMSEEIQLVEMLFCKDGCHNGDGVR